MQLFKSLTKKRTFIETVAGIESSLKMQLPYILFISRIGSVHLGIRLKLIDAPSHIWFAETERLQSTLAMVCICIFHGCH